VLEAKGSVTDPHKAGEDAGSFKQRIARDGAGQLVVHYDDFKIAPGKQGNGFVTGLHNHAMEGFRRLGVDRVETLATEVGGYAWAKLGFEFSPGGGTLLAQRTAQAMEARMIVEMSHAFQEISGAEYAALAPLLIEEGATWKPGILSSTQEFLKLPGTLPKRLLLNSGWHGALQVLPRIAAAA
jgi:hypothetical protein